ncbi:uncharacterized protein BDV17DRAFT_288346 [Aspergillus undulatus]|uniref:uncharacterized protein n=1 Tax=Aspergillus undulatus TaxID=1810928 RepID=UPI003CCD7C95
MAVSSALVAAPLLARSSLAAAICKPESRGAIANIVNFGDSASDKGRLEYMFNNDSQLPSADTLLPIANATATGGLVWPCIVSQKMSANTLNYAISGSSCSRGIVEARPDGLPEGQSFAAILDDQLPAFFAGLEFEDKLHGPAGRTANHTVYTVWIGANELALGGLLREGNEPGTTLTSVVECN